MDKSYQPQDIEQRLYERWEEQGYFAPQGDGDPYCICIPPPNVTGTLHMGHAFQDTIMDALTRYHRMKGHRTLWQPGMDHAGIATQMVVERLLNAEGTSRRDLGREKFVERVWQWKDESGGQIAQQTRRLGASVDWSRDRFTMDEGLSEAVREVFVQLYEEGLIYRGKRLVNWDPVLHTALSDLEVLSDDEAGHLWHFRYPLASGDGHLVVATTRPETMLGDSAVAVHPDDERYKDLVGQEIVLPIVGRRIPIIADDYVDPEFGTGCVKITPAHDFNDYDIGKRHDLPMYNILTDDAALNDEVPESYRGLDRFVARDKIVAEFESLDLLEKIEDYTVKIPRGDRSHAVVEPYLTDQWYVKIEPLAKPAIEAVETGRIKFVPENWSKTYFDWMYNIQDWCISRQLWWGHRIPAWYDDEGNVYVGHDEDAVREKHSLAPIRPAPGRRCPRHLVLFGLVAVQHAGLAGEDRSARRVLSGQCTGYGLRHYLLLGRTHDHVRHEVHGRRAVPRSLHSWPDPRPGRSEDVEVERQCSRPARPHRRYRSRTLVKKRTAGMMQDHLAPKIEKSTRQHFPDGIDAYGCDALRMTFGALATTGRDIRFDLGRIEGYKNFCNKLWNAARYVLMNTEDLDAGDVEFTAADRWIQARLDATTREMHKHFRTYRLDLAVQVIYEFTWHEFCDWYLELSKPVLQSMNRQRRTAARHTQNAHRRTRDIAASAASA